MPSSTASSSPLTPKNSRKRYFPVLPFSRFPNLPFGITKSWEKCILPVTSALVEKFGLKPGHLKQFAPKLKRTFADCFWRFLSWLKSHGICWFFLLTRSKKNLCLKSLKFIRVFWRKIYGCRFQTWTQFEQRFFVFTFGWLKKSPNE